MRREPIDEIPELAAVRAELEAGERYLSHECGMSEAWVRQNRRMAIASKLVTMPDGNISAVAAGLPIDNGRKHPDLFRIARGPTPDLAMARAVDRLVRNGYRVGMSRVVLGRLLDHDGGADDSYEPTVEDGPWLIEFARRLRDQRATPA